jgi:4-hydroxy-tetrahydrodipicolinate synthase
MAREIGRLLTAMVTPFAADGAVDEARCGELARALLASGSDGLVLTGTTGECPALDIEEQVGVWRAVRAAVGPDATLIAGASTNSTTESLEMVRQGAGAGMDALMLTVPYYNKPSQAGLLRHFEVLTEATALPCILYNVPSRTALNMTAETTVRLAELPNVVGVKEASGDLAQIAEIIERTGGSTSGPPPVTPANGDAAASSGSALETPFRVWSGNDGDTLPLLAIGGYGVVSVASHLVGRQIAAMIEAALGGRAEAAAALHRRLAPLVDVLFIESNPTPLKFALNELGFRVGPVRLPLVPPTEASASRIRAELARHAIDLPIAV